MTIRGTHGDDDLTGTAGNDIFALWQGGNDTVDAGSGNDIIRMGAALNAGDKIDGGDGRDVVGLNGDYSAGLVFNADTMTNVEVLTLVGGHSYNLTLNDGNVAAGQNLFVKGGSLGAGDQLIFDGSAETDGRYYVVAGAGDDVITGGAQGDHIYLQNGGADTANGGGGNDVFYLGGSLWSDDKIDGGAGFDTVHVSGGFAGGDTLALTATTMQNVEDFVINSGSFMAVITDDATVAAGATLTVNASAVTGAFTFDGSAETDGQFNIIASSGNDTLTGGAGNDTFRMGANFTYQDQIDGGAGIDTVILNGMGDDEIPFTTTTMVNVEKLVLQSGHVYDLITDDATVAAGQRLLVDGSALHAADTLTFDGSAETDGSFKIIGGAGNDFLTGGANNDVFDLAQGGNDHASGGGGDDRIIMGAALTMSDRISGGAGFDTVVLDGGAAVTFAAATMTGVERLLLDGGHSYSLTTNNGTVASGNGLTVDASALGAGDTLTFNGAAETNGFFNIIGGAGNDVITGGQDGDLIDLSHGGNDTVTLGGTVSIFPNEVYMGAALTAADHIDGSAGVDVVILQGDYTGANAVVFNATTMVDVEFLELASGFSYDLTTHDANVSAGGAMEVDFSNGNAGDTIKFDGSAETDGSFILNDGLGNDVLKGGGGNDFLSFDGGGTDVGQGGGGDDFIDACGHFDATDQFDGGTGTDTIELTASDTSTGNYTGINALVITASMMSNIEVMQLDNLGSYDITTSDGNVAAGSSLTVNGISLGSSDSLTFDGSAETDGSFDFIAGASLHTHLTGGAGNDTFDLTGADPLADTQAFGNGGNDTFEFLGNFDSSSQIIDGGTGTNTLSLDGDYAAISLVGSGTIDNIQTVTFAGGHSYTGIQVFDDVAGGGTLTLDATDLQSGDAFGLDASASTNAVDLKAGDGTYTVTGSDQNDTFEMGAHFSAANSIDGGVGIDTITLDGDYSAGLTFGAATMADVETMMLANGHSYDLVLNDANVAAGQVLSVNAAAFTAGNALTFDGSAETDGTFFIYTGAGNDVVSGGQLDDSFILSATGGPGGTDTVHGNGGDDITDAGATLDASDVIDGGAGTDTLNLQGDYSGGLTLGAGTLVGIETLQVSTGNIFVSYSYNLTSDDGNVAAGQTLAVDASGLVSTETLTFDGSAETDGSFAFTGGAGNDVLTGGAQNDTFDLTHGGNDTVHGGGGDDTFSFGGAFTAADTVDGGTGNDTLALNGNYSGGITFGATTLTSIENLDLAAGHSYHLTTDDANVAAGETLTVDAHLLTAANVLTFNGSAETNGIFAITGGAGDDTVSLSLAAVFGGSTFDGGSGNDTLELASGDDIVFGASTITNVETLKLDDGSGYGLTSNDGNVAAGATLTVDASALTGTHFLLFNGSAETDGSFTFIGGAGNDLLTGGAQADSFNLTEGGNDTAHGGAGNDTFSFGGAFTGADTVDGGAGSDTISLDGDYSAGIMLGATTMTSIENIVLAAGNSYNLTTDDANVASGASLTVNASALTGTDVLTFNGAAESDGTFTFDINVGAGAGGQPDHRRRRRRHAGAERRLLLDRRFVRKRDDPEHREHHAHRGQQLFAQPERRQRRHRRDDRDRRLDARRGRPFLLQLRHGGRRGFVLYAHRRRRRRRVLHEGRLQRLRQDRRRQRRQ